MRKPLPLTLAVLALLALAGVPRAPAASNDFTWSQTWFPSGDGTMLRADVLLPENHRATDRHGVILSIGPYFGRNESNGASSGPVRRFNDLWEQGRIFARGYAYVQVDSRGYGGSDGCNDFGGPGEQMDTEAAVNWAARQAWSNGNVGMWGKSYDAWTQVMALAENPAGLKAVVIQAPLLDAYHGMFMNGVHYNQNWYATPSLYAGYDLAPTSASDAAPEEFLYPAKGTATNPHCYAMNISMTTQPDRSLPYWQQRAIIATARASRVPVLWSHGFNDVNTKPDNILPVYSKMRGPKRAWFGQWDHVRGNQSHLVGRTGFMTEAMDFFDHYLKGEPLVDYPAVEVQTGEGWWRTEGEWPPADARRFGLKLRSGSYFDDVRDQTSTVTGGDSVWSFTQPAPYDLHFAGDPIFAARVTPDVPAANLIVVLWDVGPDEQARKITRGAYRVTAPGWVSFRLHPQDWIIRKGHRLAVALSGDDELFMGTPTAASVKVDTASLHLPFLKWRRARTLAGGAAHAMNFVRISFMDDAVIAANTQPVKFPPPLREKP